MENRVIESYDWLDKILYESKDIIIDEEEFKKKMKIINKYLAMDPPEKIEKMEK